MAESLISNYFCAFTAFVLLLYIFFQRFLKSQRGFSNTGAGYIFYPLSIKREKIRLFPLVLCILISSYELSHQDSNFLVKQFSTFNVEHLSKVVVNFTLIMMSKPRYIVILTDFVFVA